MARTKLVHTNAMVAHLWANAAQPSAHNKQQNLSFSGHDIYSYSTRVARFVERVSHGLDIHKVYFLTERHYSHTTSKHMHCIYRAISDRDVAIYVPEVGSSAQENYKILCGRIEGMIKDYMGGRSWPTRMKIYRKILSEMYPTNQIATYFNLPQLHSELWPEFHKLLQSDIVKSEAARKREETLRKQKDEEIRRCVVMRTASEMQRLYPDYWVSTGNVENDVTACHEKLWRKALPHSYFGINPVYAMLRLSYDGKCVETSQGADIRMEFVPRIWKHLNRAIKMYGHLEEFIFSTPINADHFSITGLYTNAEGSKFIQAGCHKILISEIRNMAQQLNLPMEE